MRQDAAIKILQVLRGTLHGVGSLLLSGSLGHLARGILLLHSLHNEMKAQISSTAPLLHNIQVPSWERQLS